MPVAVFVIGCSIGTERFSLVTLGNMLVVSLGVAVSAYGEINFVLMGVVLQLLAICTESTRLSLTQNPAAKQRAEAQPHHHPLLRSAMLAAVSHHSILFH